MKKEKRNKGKKAGLVVSLLIVAAVTVALSVACIIYIKNAEGEYLNLTDELLFERFREELQKRYFDYDPSEESYIPGYTWQELLDMGLVARDNDKKADSDLDGLSDYDELIVYGTNPAAFSTAGDMYSDKYKVENGLDATVYKEGFVTPNVEEGLKVELEPADALNTHVYMTAYVWDNDEEQNGYVAAITIGPYEGNIKYDLSEYGEGMTAGLVRYGGEFIKLNKYVEDDILYCKYQGDTPATLLIYKKKNERKVIQAVKNNEMLMPEAEEYTCFVSPQLWNEKVGTSREEAVIKMLYEEYQHVDEQQSGVVAEKVYRMIPEMYVKKYDENGLPVVPMLGECYDETQIKNLRKYATVPKNSPEEELFTKRTNNFAKFMGLDAMYQNKILAFKDKYAFDEWLIGYEYKNSDIRGEVQCVDNDTSFCIGEDTFIFPNFSSYISTGGNCMGLARVMATLYNGEELYPYERSYSGNMDCTYSLYGDVHGTLFDRYLDDYLNKKYFSRLGKKMYDKSKLTTEENNFVNFIGTYWMEGNDLFYLKKQYEIVKEGQNPKADALVALSEYLADGKVALVCMLGESGGHTINAYEVESCTYDPNKFFIHCYDTNYVGKTTTIEVYVNEKTDTFSYVYEPSENLRFSSESYSSTLLKSGEKCNIIYFCDENMNPLK